MVGILLMGASLFASSMSPETVRNDLVSKLSDIAKKGARAPEPRFWDRLFEVLDFPDLCLLEAQRELRAGLCRLPKAAQNLYQSHVESKARKAYFTAVVQSDVTAMEQMVRRYPCTPFAHKALLWLATHAVDRCEWDRAITFLEAAASHNSLTARQQVKIALAYYGAGSHASDFERALAQIDALGGITLGEKTLSAEEVRKEIERTVTQCPDKSGAETYREKDSRQQLRWLLAKEGLGARWKEAVDVPLSYTSVSAGEIHSCGMTRDGRAFCWGKKNDEETLMPRELPKIISLSTGGFHACAITAERKVACWGSNHYGQSQPPEGLKNVISLSAAYFHSCAVTQEGKAVCWGSDTHSRSQPPEKLPALSSVSAGGYHSLGLTREGTVKGWGYNVDRRSEIEAPSAFVSISAGFQHSCALTREGKVFCSGYNSSGQSKVPKDLPPLTAISAGGSHTCGLSKKGTVHCWGSDSYGESTPPKTLPPVISVSAGGFHTCALTAKGEAHCWGSDQSNQTTVRKTEPHPLRQVLAACPGGIAGVLGKKK